MKKLIISAFLVSLILSGTSFAGWVTQESNTTQDLNAVYFATSIEGFVVGNNGTIRRTVNGGTNWTEISTGAATGITLYDVVASTEGHGYVCGANGTLKKLLNHGITFETINLSATAIASYNLVKASNYNNNWFFAAATSEALNSYLLISAEGSTNWSLIALTSLEVTGVHLAPGSGTSYKVWVWGKYNAGDLNGYPVIGRIITNQFVSVYNGSSPTDRAIKDVCFVNENVGYAAMDGGHLLKTTDGGSSWLELLTGTTENLNAAQFITTSFGWVVGDNGAVAHTADGGTFFSAYTLEDTTTNINDICVRAEIDGLALVHAYIVGTRGSGTNGKIYKLASPTLTSITPNTKFQGWIGAVTIEGSGFIDGAVASFPNTSDIRVLYTSYEADTTLEAFFVITPEAVTGSITLLVTNPDATAKDLNNAFTIAPNTWDVTIESVWLGEHKYYPPSSETPSIPNIRSNILPQPRISFEVFAYEGVSAESVNCKIIFESTPIFIHYVTQESITPLGNDRLKIDVSPPIVLPEGTTLNIRLYAEDVNGHVGINNLLVSVGTENPPSDGQKTPGVEPDMSGVIVPVNNTNDLTDIAWPCIINLNQYVELKNFSIYLINTFTGQRAYKKEYREGVVVTGFTVKKQAIPGKGIVTQYNFNIPTNELPKNLGTGIYPIIVVNDDSGKIIAKNTLTVAPKSMKK